MSAGIGRLGELYGLSPATMAGLANVSGTTPVGEGVPPPAPAQDPNELGDSAGGFPGLSGAGALPEQPTKVAASPKEVYGPPEPTIGPPAPPPYDPYTDPNLGGGPASGSAAMTVPAHWQPGSHAVSLQHGMSPEELEPAAYAEDVASGHEIGAANKRLEAAQQRGMADAVYSAAHAQASKIANDRIQQLNQDRDNYVTKETKRLDQMALATQKEVDPDAYWRERGSGSKLAAALMIGLNQFAVLWRGRGTNTAMEIINKGIDDNIHAQQANISNAGRALEQRQNLYARNVAAFGDKERAILATKVQYLDQVAAMADGQKAQAGVAENEAAHEQMLGAIYKERAKAAADFAKLTHTQATEQMNAHFVPQQTVGLGGPSAAKREGNLVTLPDGTSYVMPSEKTANEAIEKVQNLDKLQRRNNEIMQLRLKARKLDPVVNATEFNTLKHQLADLADEKVALLSLALGQGTVKEDEYKRAKEFATNAENGLGFFKGNPIADAEFQAGNAALRAQSSRWGQDMRSHVTTAGGSVYQRGYVKDPKTNQLRPVGRYTGQDATPTEHLAPAGSKPLDSTDTLPTAPTPSRMTTPFAPRFDRR